MAFNYNGARQAGYSDEEINSYLSKRGNDFPTPGPSPTASQYQTQQPTQQQGRLLGGALPIGGGILGGIGGGAVGAAAGGIGAFPGSLAGTAAGTGAGVALENMLEDLLGRQQETVPEQLISGGKQVAFQTAADLAGSAAMKYLLSPVAKFAKGALGDWLPKQLLKLSLPEATGPSKTFFRKSVAGTGKELPQEILERGITGSAKELEEKTLSKIGGEGIEGSLIAQEKELLSRIPVTEVQSLVPIPQVTKMGPGGSRSFTLGKTEYPEALNNVQQFVYDTIQEASNRVINRGGVTGVSDLTSVSKEANDIWKLQKQKSLKEGWETIIDLKRAADKKAKGKATVDITSTAVKLNNEIANLIREKMMSDPDILASAPELRGIITEEQFWLRLRDAVETRGYKPDFPGPSLTAMMRTLLNPAWVTPGTKALSRGTEKLGELYPAYSALQKIMSQTGAGVATNQQLFEQ